MKIWYTPYALVPQGRLNARAGAAVRDGFLLKVEFADVGVGYADCHPLPEWGDEPRQAQLESLRLDRPSALVSRSLELAHWDATARRDQKSLFLREPVLASHYTLSDWSSFSLPLLNELAEQGYQFLKVKVGNDLDEAGQFLRRLVSVMPEGFKLRLDFNLSATVGDLDRWMAELGNDFVSRLDFIEDPFFYEPTGWREFSQRWGVPLALDQELHWDLDLAGAEVLVIKPARNSGEDIERCAELYGEKRWVFTHAMDHPVGRMMALAYAANFYNINPQKLEPGGFESQTLFEPSAFDQGIFTDGCLQLGTDDLGVGFTSQLEQCEWVECR
ncbi:MAG: hypothetical protein IT288_01960 [Bdellovibrionales bacterium]|nr:hypothetical protein [Bdellovibrionales bacterium]